MTKSAVSRRHFNRRTLVGLLAATAAPSLAGPSAQQRTGTGASGRREIIRQQLPGEPARELILVEVTYPPATASPAHLHANGVMAFVVSGALVSKVGDEPERTFRAGDAWWEPRGAVHRVSRNASSAEPATLLAIYIAAKGATGADLMRPIGVDQ
jgi:quercetin dioxygenase-like cupin family protein